MFNLNLSECTVSCLTIVYTCMNSAQHMQTTPVTENMEKYGLSMHDGGNLI